MAQLVPRVSLEEISNKPERDVARALVEQLPDEFRLYHAYPWLRADRNDHDGKTTLKEGEADFVVVDPGHGILVVEVKGGQIEYEPSSGLWFRRLADVRKRITDPFDQARRNQFAIEERVRRVSFPDERSSPFAFGHVVVFPDCVYQGDLPAGTDPSIILSAFDLPQLGLRARKALQLWDRRPKQAPLDRHVLDRILKALSPIFELMPVLFRQVEEQEERLVVSVTPCAAHKLAHALPTKMSREWYPLISLCLA